MLKKICRKFMEISLILAMVIGLIPIMTITSFAAASTFTFKNSGSGGTGVDGPVNSGPPITTTWTENGYTLKMSITGAKADEIIGSQGAVAASNSGYGWGAGNSELQTTISVTVSIDGGYAFDLKGLEVYDLYDRSGSLASTYTLTTPKGGSDFGSLPNNTGSGIESDHKELSYSDAQFNGISSFTISVTAQSLNETGLAISDLVLDNIAPPAGNATAAASANTLTPVVGVDDAITLTVKDTLGNIDTAFDGTKNVTITGVEAAPDGTYGSFNGTTLNANSAGAGQVISVTFADGVATPNLKLNKSDAQTIGFSIATVTTPATNTPTITPTHGTAASMAVTQDITAPASNGGQFAQQPSITLKDAYGNTCTSDNATVVTAAKEDAGTWTLTGTTTATASSGVASFTNLGATNASLVNNVQLGFTSGSMTKVTSAPVTLPAPAGNATAAASANTLTPVVGVDDAITLTVKDTLGNIDTAFDGTKNVTITGVEAAPDGTYGSFNGTTLNANSAGAGQVISVTFADGVATPNLKLNKADAQTIGFSIATVTTPATNTPTITPTHGTAASMAVTQDITAPASNGGQFAQQPSITLKDAYGNTCTSDNATVVTAAKEDAGTWTLTGTTTATASSGVASFTNLGATNASLVNNVQLGFTSGSMTKVTSAPVTLPAPTSSSGSGGGGGCSTTTTTSSQDKVIVIVNGKEHNAGTERKTTENGKSIVTVKVDNKTIETKIEEAVKNNPTGISNVVLVPVADKKSEVTRVELTGDIVKKLEQKTFDVAVKRDNVEYVIPAEEFTISKVAQHLGLQEKDLKDIKVEVEITKLDEKAVAKYNKVAKANGAELVFSPVSFEVTAKTTKADGKTGTVEISKFNNYVERVIEIPAGVDASKITTGIVFNPDGTYSHVPTEVFKKDGKWYAKLNSLTNSDYSVVWNPVIVKLVENHWAKNVVNDMASRLVVFNPESFDPNKAITRADFAEYIVRALGVYREGAAHDNKFKDVSANGERTFGILIANEYGIVTGYSDGTFKPEQKITREQAMVMYQRAMKVTKLTGSDTNRYQNYTDFAEVSGWASTYVKDVLAAHVFNGTSTTTISPKSNLTYAEAAQAIKNLLVESKLINK